jgi:hypothetical protein
LIFGEFASKFKYLFPFVGFLFVLILLFVPS